MTCPMAALQHQKVYTCGKSLQYSKKRVGRADTSPLSPPASELPEALRLGAGLSDEIAGLS